MNKYKLPTETIIAGKTVPFRSDFRDILYLFEILNDPDLLDHERILLAAENFYDTEDYKEDIDTAISDMMEFIRGGTDDSHSNTSKKPLYDWDQDYDIIVAPINRVVGKDIRGLEYFHWWTFISAFMEIGESTFSTFVSIRDKKNRGVKLEKWEERLYKENKDRINLTKRVDSTTQSIMDEIMGKGV